VTLLRLAAAGGIIAGLVGLYYGVRALLLARARRGTAALPGRTPGVPGIVYFTTPQCAACKAVQRPALAELKRRLADRVQIIEIDALARPDLARSWSVLTVPTTFVLDRDGRAVHVNAGVASTARLLDQLSLAG
jgi:thiol-disulfide isomerase/thioredoxin